jgi:hypothetical protein
MAEEKNDVVVLGPPTKDGEGVHVIRASDEKVEAGELRTLKEGKPIHGEVLSLEPRKENPRVCDVRWSYRPPSPGPKKGPAQVASQSYRDNWDEIFGVGTSEDRLPS